MRECKSVRVWFRNTLLSSISALRYDLHDVLVDMFIIHWKNVCKPYKPYSS